MPPDPNHANFEYLKFLSSCNDFRFLDGGPGTHTSKKRTISSELGQAFCRYFLYEHLGITYFAHMNRILDKETHPAFDQLMIKRVQGGDVPDYLCAKKSNQPYIAEAKGRFSNINFHNSEFNEWRNQFNRIRILDKNSATKKLKGYIVATKFTTERNNPSNKSKIFAEDPDTIGEEFLEENSIGIGQGCISIHYARLLAKLGLNLLSESLDIGFIVPEYLSFNLPIWKCNVPYFKDKFFVGGFASDIDPRMIETINKTLVYNPNVLKLGIPSPIFFGIEVSVVRQLRAVCLGNWNLLSSMPGLADVDLNPGFRPSNLAWLRDGSISGALDFFEFIEIQSF